MSPPTITQTGTDTPEFELALIEVLLEQDFDDWAFTLSLPEHLPLRQGLIGRFYYRVKLGMLDKEVRALERDELEAAARVGRAYLERDINVQRVLLSQEFNDNCANLTRYEALNATIDLITGRTGEINDALAAEEELVRLNALRRAELTTERDKLNAQARAVWAWAAHPEERWPEPAPEEP